MKNCRNLSECSFTLLVVFFLHRGGFSDLFSLLSCCLSRLSCLCPTLCCFSSRASWLCFEALEGHHISSCHWRCWLSSLFSAWVKASVTQFFSCVSLLSRAPLQYHMSSFSSIRFPSSKPGSWVYRISIKSSFLSAVSVLAAWDSRIDIKTCSGCWHKACTLLACSVLGSLEQGAGTSLSLGQKSLSHYLWCLGLFVRWGAACLMVGWWWTFILLLTLQPTVSGWLNRKHLTPSPLIVSCTRSFIHFVVLVADGIYAGFLHVRRCNQKCLNICYPTHKICICMSVQVHTGAVN